jgi:hypothetical protein
MKNDVIRHLTYLGSKFNSVFIILLSQWHTCLKLSREVEEKKKKRSIDTMCRLLAAYFIIIIIIVAGHSLVSTNNHHWQTKRMQKRARRLIEIKN